MSLPHPTPSVPLSAIRQPAILYGPDGTVRAANDTATGLAGRPLAGFTMAGLISLLSIRHADGRLLTPDELPAARALAGDEVVDARCTVTAPGGRRLSVIVTASPVCEDGGVTGALSIWQDATALAESEERFRSVFEKSVDGMLLTEPDGTLLVANRAALELLGRTEDELRQTGRADVVDPAAPAALAAHDRDGHVRTEQALLRPDGTRILVDLTSTVFTGTDGRRRTGTVLRDITEHRRAEQALIESRQELADVIRVTGAGYYRHAADMSRGTVDGRFAEILGFRPAELLPFPAFGPWYRSRVHPDDREAAFGPYAAFTAGETERYEAEFRVMTRDRGYRWVRSVSASVERDGAGRVVTLAGLLFDIDDQRTVEETLRQSREWFRVMGETLPYGVWRANPHGGAEYVSQSFLDLLEMTQEEQREFGWTHRLPPEDVEPMLERWLHCIETGEDWDSEHRVLGPDGIYHTVLTRGRPVRDRDGAIVAWVGINLDIDERKRAELDLLETAEKLRRSNEELQRFAYVASHDLQEPLRPIVSFSQLLQRRYAGQLDEEADEYLAFIVEGGQRLQTLIRDLLQFSRLEATASPPAPTDAGRVVEGVVRRFATPIQTAGATVEADPLPPVLVDPTQLDMAVANLLSNALKYRRPKVPPAIRVSAERRGGMVEFSVQDNGIGIEAEYFDRIFVIFQRLHTKDRYEGTGIGLAIVKKIVERHGGRVRVESTPGKGSTFFFTLRAA